MTAKQILDSFSETLMQHDRILSSRERELVTNLLQHARTASNANPESQAAVHAVIASAVGETVAQRAFTVLGGSIVGRILAPMGNGGVEDSTSYTMHKPPSPGPQPPGSPGVIKPATPPAPSPGPQPPGHGPQPPTPPRPLTDVPTGPQPPHGQRAVEIKMQRQGFENLQRTGLEVLDKPDILTAQFVVREEFLSPQELQEVIRYTSDHEADFQMGEVISTSTDGGTIDCSHRRSRVLVSAGKHEGIITDRIRAVLPLVLSRLGMEEFPIKSVECQITASNDGDFFRQHPDNGHAEVASRHLTFVYFFHREPRQFQGGELRIHDARWNGSHYVSTGSYQTIVPQQNQIVFFPCALLHEITQVECPSRLFADSRFTLNGWLHK